MLTSDARSGSSTEKSPLEHAEFQAEVQDLESVADCQDDPEKVVEWKVIAKIDYRVVPMLCLMYLLSFLDR